MKDEAAIIRRLARVIPSCIGARQLAGVPVGIGDDAAVVRASRGRDWVVSTDAFIEGRHFLTRVHPPYAAGFKALARATSDLAAMGATPRYFLLTLALPARRAGDWLGWFARGMAHGARMFRMRLIGGDVSRDDHVAAAVTVIGEAPRQGVLTRGGGRPGDAVYVTGRLGAAQAGLEILLRKGSRAFVSRAGSYWINRHIFPYPRLAIGQPLAERRLASAAIDISDGLSTDLGRLCAASGVGAVIHAAALPIARDERPGTHSPDSRRERAAQLHRALHGGEDYELLFTVPRRAVARVPREVRGVPITRIGELTARRPILLEAAGRTQKLRPLGWDHFARG
jgi:thiamine-monophosphate kinase